MLIWPLLGSFYAVIRRQFSSFLQSIPPHSSKIFPDQIVTDELFIVYSGHFLPGSGGTQAQPSIRINSANLKRIPLQRSNSPSAVWVWTSHVYFLPYPLPPNKDLIARFGVHSLPVGGRMVIHRGGYGFLELDHVIMHGRIRVHHFPGDMLILRLSPAMSCPSFSFSGTSYSRFCLGDKRDVIDTLLHRPARGVLEGVSREIGISGLAGCVIGDPLVLCPTGRQKIK